MVALALERQPERRGRVRPAVLLRLAERARQRDIDVVALARGRGDEVLARGGDGAHGAEVLERVDGLGAGRLEEQLGDVGAALGQRPDSVGEIATVGVGLPRERDLEVRNRAARSRHAGIVLGGRRFVWCPAPVIRARAMKAALGLGVAALTVLTPAAASAPSVQADNPPAKPAVAPWTAAGHGDVT